MSGIRTKFPTKIPVRDARFWVCFTRYRLRALITVCFRWFSRDIRERSTCRVWIRPSSSCLRSWPWPSSWPSSGLCSNQLSEVTYFSPNKLLFSLRGVKTVCRCAVWMHQSFTFILFLNDTIHTMFKINANKN